MDIKEQNYYIVYDWMTKELKLKGVEKDVYAIIYSFTHSSEIGLYYGSQEYLANKIGTSRRRICSVLNYLTNKELVIKEKIKIGANYYCYYKTLK